MDIKVNSLTCGLSVEIPFELFLKTWINVHLLPSPLAHLASYHHYWNGNVFKSTYYYIKSNGNGKSMRCGLYSRETNKNTLGGWPTNNSTPDPWTMYFLCQQKQSSIWNSEVFKILLFKSEMFDCSSYLLCDKSINLGKGSGVRCHVRNQNKEKMKDNTNSPQLVKYGLKSFLRRAHYINS